MINNDKELNKIENMNDLNINITWNSSYKYLSPLNIEPLITTCVPLFKIQLIIYLIQILLNQFLI